MILPNFSLTVLPNIAYEKYKFEESIKTEKEYKKILGIIDKISITSRNL